MLDLILENDIADGADLVDLKNENIASPTIVKAASMRLVAVSCGRRHWTSPANAGYECCVTDLADIRLDDPIAVVHIPAWKQRSKPLQSNITLHVHKHTQTSASFSFFTLNKMLCAYFDPEKVFF